MNQPRVGDIYIMPLWGFMLASPVGRMSALQQLTAGGWVAGDGALGRKKGFSMALPLHVAVGCVRPGFIRRGRWLKFALLI